MTEEWMKELAEEMAKDIFEDISKNLPYLKLKQRMGMLIDIVAAEARKEGRQEGIEERQRKESRKETFYGGPKGFDYVLLHKGKIEGAGGLKSLLKLARKHNWAVGKLYAVRFERPSG